MAGAFLCGHLLAQPVLYKCTGTDGSIEFSDKACAGEATGEPIAKPGDAAAAERKAYNDRRILRDDALRRQYEAEREAEEAALRAAQEKHLQIAADIARRLAQERDARNAGTTSVLPSSGCVLCRTPGDATWPGYMR